MPVPGGVKKAGEQNLQFLHLGEASPSLVKVSYMLIIGQRGENTVNC